MHSLIICAKNYFLRENLCTVLLKERTEFIELPAICIGIKFLQKKNKPLVTKKFRRTFISNGDSVSCSPLSTIALRSPILKTIVLFDILLAEI